MNIKHLFFCMLLIAFSSCSKPGYEKAIAEWIQTDSHGTWTDLKFELLEVLETEDVTVSDSLRYLNNIFEEQLKETLKANKVDKFVDEIVEFAITSAYEETDRETYQAMEAFIHNLNTMHSRAGAQVPFSSINYGMDTSSEGRMVMRNILLATEAGLGHGETPIFPIQIFRVKEGINYNEGEPNYDLFK